MKKYMYLVLVMALAAILFTTFSNRATQDPALAEEIVALFEQGQTEIDLTEITTFDWTKAELFGPYTTDEVIEESMDITFKGDNGHIDLLDDRVLLVFANDQYAVKTVVLQLNCSLRDHKMLLIQE
ncbi:MAG: hypothetical protein ABS949_03925 [Solibacillus sp.]